ncbi:MAG TPA: BA14K family protein, partial [Pseudorhizobium sp.]|nr:BA14K family protein [Pseudorhizobium sp.]
DDRRGYYRGHRGSREYRRGYRRHNDGWWYPLAAFGAGAIIGGAINNQPRAQGLPSRHVQWCADRYRTYRASDNTYVPRVGVRAQCRSPYL